jgi:hypothetical protein
LTFTVVDGTFNMSPGQISRVRETIGLELDAENLTWSVVCGYATLTWDISGADFCGNSVTTIQENEYDYYERIECTPPNLVSEIG